jgi:hypothetical protein
MPGWVLRDRRLRVKSALTGKNEGLPSDPIRRTPESCQLIAIPFTPSATSSNKRI